MHGISSHASLSPFSLPLIATRTFTPATTRDSLAPAEIVGPSAVDNSETGTLAQILVDAETVELVKRLATRQKIPEATALNKH